MAGRTFTSPAGAAAKMKHGRIYPPKGHKQGENMEKALDPLRHASSTIPKFSTRQNNTNGKHGFHTKPARPPAGRLAHRPGKVNRGSGKEHRAQL